VKIVNGILLCILKTNTLFNRLLANVNNLLSHISNHGSIFIVFYTREWLGLYVKTNIRCPNEPKKKIRSEIKNN